ncbi:5'-3' exonuclease H3TH domain-containing protein [Buchnera aphidicola]|uniref:5'-3' exonuclease n=1 Tax=Buchnera aphidicola TaxID=9 RepID=UPI0030EC1872
MKYKIKNKKSFKKKIIIIIDGNNYLYRYYYIFKNLKNHENKPTGVIYGILKLIKNLIKIYSPKNIIFVFDHPSKNFRKKIYKPYKSNRLKMPIDLKNQIKPLLNIIKCLGFPILRIPKIEADDIIGTIIKKESKLKYKILICTSDKDICQLIKKNVKILNFKNKILGIKEIKKKFGIAPKTISCYLSLVGDKSDNIPGAPGIGKKSAVKILKKYNSLKKIYKNLNNLKKIKFRNSIKFNKIFIKNKKKIFLYFKLTTIKKNIFIKKYKKKIKLKKIKLKKLFCLFQKYNLKSLKKFFLKKNFLK